MNDRAFILTQGGEIFAGASTRASALRRAKAEAKKNGLAVYVEERVTTLEVRPYAEGQPPEVKLRVRPLSANWDGVIK